MIKIDKKVPLSDPERSGGRYKLYPFGEMVIGDSFAVTFIDDEDSRKKQRNIMSSARTHRFAGKRFTTRVNKEEKEVRIWRVK